MSINILAAANAALSYATASIEKFIAEFSAPNRIAFHVFVLNPRAQYGAPGQDVPNLPVLVEHTFGEKDDKKWTKDFREIARSKAQVCWRTGMSSRKVGEDFPYLLQEADSKFPGGVVCDGLIVAGSGLEWQHDEMFAHFIIAAIWAEVRLQRERLMADPEKIWV